MITPLPDCSSHEELANKFADFFIDNIEKIRSQFQQSNLYTPPSQKCKNLTQFRSISDEETQKILNSMKKKTICDVDPCNINLPMEFKGILLRTWTRIITKSLLNGSFLQSWKKAVSSSLIKSSILHTEFTNYWPISNLSFISKSIEKAALLQLSTFFEDQNLLPTYQRPYHKHHSTETAVLNKCDEILENAECNKLTAMVCLDLSAAFDTVNHSILKTVMEHYFGLNDTALQWLSSYISNRQFSVKIGGSFSHTHTINFSVPQGSILGWVLFSCYVSTLPEVTKQKSNTIILGYADDHAFAQAFTQKDTLVKQTVKKVDRIKNWMCLNHLHMNDTKTESTTFGTTHLLSKKNLDSITIGGTRVNCSKTIKFLGAFLDETLSFKQHVGWYAKLALYGIHLIKNVRKYLTMATTKMLMCTLVLSQLDCINSFLTNTSLTTTKLYKKIQNQAAWIIYKKTKWTSATSSMKQLHWLPIRYRCCFKLLTIVYKTLHGMGPAYLSERLKIKNNTRNTQLTSSTTLYLEVPFNKKRSVADRGFSYMAAQHWNALPIHIKIASNLQQLKKLLKTYFFNIVYN